MGGLRGDRCADGQGPKIKASARSKGGRDEDGWRCDMVVVCRTIATSKRIRIAVAGASSHWPF